MNYLENVKTNNTTQSQGDGETDNWIYNCIQTLKSILESNLALANVSKYA